MASISFGIPGLVPAQNGCLASALGQHAQDIPDAPAILASGCRVLTYRHLNDHVNRVVQTLRALGLQRQDRVAVYVPNGPEMAVAFVAVATGTVCVPLNPSYPDDDLDVYLGHVKAKALVIDAHLDTLLRQAAQARGLSILELESRCEAEAGLFTLRVEAEAVPSAYTCSQADDIALILRTSGTTAHPRMVPLTHANLIATAWCAQAALGLSAHDRCLNMLPLYHSHGLVANLMPALVTGGSVVCVSRFDPGDFFDCLTAFQPTWFSAVPTIYQSILSQAMSHRAVLERHTLRFMRSGSAPLPPQILQALEQVFETPVLETYGMTEGCSISCNPLPPQARKASSVGRAVSSDIAIMDGRGTLLPTGVDGEIVVRGANVFAGYDQDDLANCQSFVRGWFRTGDQGHLDVDGYLFITGRIKELINRGGQNIEPRDIDRVLMAHPGVAQAMAFGLPHQRLGEDVAAAVVLRPGMQTTEDELRQFAALRLAPFQIPQHLLIVDALPQNSMGKVQRVGLAEKLGVQAVGPAHREAAEADGVVYTPLQEVLASIWAQVFECQHVGAHENFFCLGGDSIMATRMLSRVQDVLHVDMPIRDFFISPTISEMAREIERLQHGVLQPPLPLLPVPRDGPLPLSYPQQRLWFLHQLGLSAVAYTLVHVLELRGALNVAALEQSLHDCIARHEILRTTFLDIAGEPAQQVGPPPAGVLEMIDMETPEPAAWEGAVRARALEEIRRPFDLGQGPLFRPLLLRLNPSRHVFILTLHHIVADAWSHGVMWRDLGALYEAHTVGPASSLPALPVQYADFAVWQLHVMADTALEPQLHYWTRTLAGASPLRLPTDRPRPPRWTSRGARHPIRLSLALLHELKALSQRQGVTLFMTLLAAFATLLHRYTQQDDFIVGTLMANRNRAALEGLIGFFINTLALRVNLEDRPRFDALLGRVREVTLDAYHYRELPFEKLLEVLRPSRDLSRNPLFQVLFVLQNSPQFPPRFGDIAVCSIDVDSATAKFDLTLDLTETPEGLRGWFEYSTDLFDAVTIARMAGHFQTLVDGIVAHPQASIDELSLLRAAERHQLVYDWNQTLHDFSLDQCLHWGLEAQASRQPDAVALIDGDEQLTYQALNRRANQLAHYLQTLNIGPETVVGLCLERSCDLVVGLCGILKAGGAYLPLDPSYPADRLAFMLDDAHVSVLLTQAHLAPTLPSQGVHIVCIDAIWQTIARYSTRNLDMPVRSDNLAYVLYTSGSTGKPKGVLGLHYTVLNTVMWMWQRFPITDDDVCCQKTSISFGDSLQELFGPLLRGARLVLIPDAILKDASQFVEVLATHGVTRLILVPSLLRLLLDTVADLDRRLPRLRLWIAGGESLPLGVCQRFREVMPHGGLVNLYGMSETTDDATYYDTRMLDLSRDSVPIGRPIANTQLYVLDRALQPVPIGVPGELYIGGVGLTRGYLDRPALTVDVFMPDAISGAPGARLYKTGDLVRYRPDGALEYFGRLDSQVKVRGFRIELEEVEVALEQHPAVRQALVLDREDTPGERYLAAYIRTAEDASLTIDALRAFLHDRLPPHMVPTAFVFLDVMPQTPSGKVNRRALPMPPRLRPELAAAFVSPRTPTEEVVASIWSAVLDLDGVGIHDNFFDLGGHSLLAVRVLSRLRDAFQATISLQALFDAPTIASLSSYIERQRHEGAGDVALALAPAPRPNIIPATVAQEHIWLMARLLPRTPFFNVSHAFRLLGPVRLEALERSVNALIQRHDSLRTAFVPQEGLLVQQIADACPLTLVVEELDIKSENSHRDTVARLIQEEAEQPFVLARAPLMRVRLMRLDEHDYVLLLTWHHLIMDGWSMGVFNQELAILYDAFAQDAPPSLPPLQVQYADYTLWYDRWRETAGWERQIAYWQRQLRSPLPVLNLPSDRPRGSGQGVHTARETLVIPSALAKAIRQLSRQEGTTLFMTLLAAFKMILRVHTGQEDLCVATHVANRAYREVEDLIGYLVNTLFLRTYLGGNPSCRELLQRVRATTLEAYEHQDLALEDLVQILEKEHHVHRSSLSQVMFVLHNTEQYALMLPGLEVQPWDPEMSVYRHTLQATTFDLILIVQENADGFVSSCIYQTALFNADTVQRLLIDYQHVLERLSNTPEQSLQDLAEYFTSGR